MKEFVEYLEEKRIDPITFKLEEAELFGIWENEFMQMHPTSFTSQKLYLINNIRRRFTLPEDRVKVPVKKVKTAVKVAVSSAEKAAAKPPSGVAIKRPAAKPTIKPKSPTEPVEPIKSETDSSLKEEKSKKVVIKPKIPIKKSVALKPKIANKDTEKSTEREKKVLAPKVPVPKKKAALQPKIGGEKKKNPQPVMKPKIPPKKD